MPDVFLTYPLAEPLEGEIGLVPVTRFPWVIGRHVDCDMCVNTPPVSRQHCRLFTHDYEVWVEDLASRNGTQLNGVPLVGATPLRDGDRLTVACVPIDVRILEPGPSGRTRSDQSLPTCPQ